ncbi:calmodulin-regulated spectrin-associated protein 1-like isoform X2 [Gigantopelta aegis]|uniref:calmodulin-regulated spectrin-associated protein 1-like isoform X2 n=1 Tax=Gigantopelta aegis TaxID=1735272 RepID=UPI001B88ABF7|nr:calmodulin-regulated spectrin-associated protein 1-like isoform X2 [Gigantopelta aegis]
MDSEDTENDVIEIVPLDEYQFSRAKLKSSLAWILQKAYREIVPPEFKDPFYENSDGGFQVKPQLINSLVSSDVYCQACASMFSETSQQWQGHCSIIQVLSRKGIYVMEKDESAVTETILMQTAPFRVNAHLALIDSLMLAYASEIVSVERAVHAVRRITTFNASSELPSSTEDAIVFWLNKVCVAAQAREKKSQQIESVSPSDARTVPVMTDMLKDIGDGCSVALVCSFYCPQSLNQQDICLKKDLGIADCLYNLRLIKMFCEKHLPTNFFHFTYEDLLYSRVAVRENLLAFLAELFFWFEIQRLTETGSLLNGQDTEAIRPGSGKPGVTKHQVPISNATKRSFHKTNDSRFPNTPDLNKSNSTPHISQNRQVLLQKRQNGSPLDNRMDGEAQQRTDTSQYARRAHSVSPPQDGNIIKQSVLAWQEQEEHQQRRSSVLTGPSEAGEASVLLANVSIDSELCQSFAADELNFAELDTPRTPLPTLPNIRQTDGMKLESVTPGDQSRQSNLSDQSERLEPLMPAVLKPAKEKHLNHTKAQERDEMPRKRVMSPTKPRKSRSPPVTASQPSEAFSSLPQGDITVEATVSLNVNSSQLTNSSSDEPVIVTPLPPDQLTPRLIESKNTDQNDVGGRGQGQGEEQFQGRGYEAFYINPDVSVEVSLPSLPLQTIDNEVASSYTIVDQVYTLESARAAGIPVVTKSNETSPLRRATSRDDSMTSSRSSGDFSDHESHKIHYDHKTRETTAAAAKISPRAVLPPPVVEARKPTPVISETPKILDPATEKARALATNFAKIKHFKDTYGNVDGSGLIYMQQGQDQQGNGQMPLKSAFLRKQADAGKKTSFAMLPNETTWPMTARQASQDAGNEINQDADQPLTALRMRLDEKRKEIERRKHRMEMQQNKMLQRLGKAAFIRVVSRHGDDAKDRSSPTPELSSSSAAGLDDRLGQLSLDGQRLRSLSESPTPHKSRPFSREGIQETIDNVRKRWFKDDDLLGGVARPADISENAEESVEPPFVGKDPAAVRSQVDVVATGDVPRASSTSPYPQPMSDSAGSLPTSENGASFEAYDSSLDKLNQSLSELQGEISRLSLQQEQILNMQSPQGAAPVDPRLHPIAKQQPPLAGYPVPHQIALPPGVHMGQGGGRHSPVVVQGQGHQDPRLPPKVPVNRSSPEVFKQMPPTSQTLPQARFADTYSVNNVPSANQQQTQFADTYSVNNVPSANQQQTRFADTYSVNNVPSAPGSHVTGGHEGADGMSCSGDQGHPGAPMDVSSENGAGDDGASSHTSSGGNEGFFVSFGDDSSTPKRSKPVLSKDRVKKTNAVAQANNSNVSTPPVENQLATMRGSPIDVQGTPTISVYKSPRATNDDSQNSSDVGYILDVSEASPHKVTEQEMLSKKDKFVEKQLRRKEEQERRRLEKENELMEQRERQRLKQEDQEQKKAEEKARRKQIYEQYLQKKQQKEVMENGGDRPIEPTRVSERSAKSKARPKSMYVRAPPSDQEDASSVSSQDDSSMRGLASPSSHYRIGSTRGNMRKAVSCQMLTQNGQPGGATYRRPPSPGGATYRRPPTPDLYRLGRRTPRNLDGSDTGDYSGPKLFVKPSSKSNRHIILNAISHCCLAGIVNTDLKNKVLEELAKSDAKHFVILFRDGGCQYRSLYSYAPETEDVTKICGVGPKQITKTMMHRFYKYNSGAKSFTEVTSTKHLSVSIDAVVLHNSLWKTGKPAPTSKKVY